MAINKRNASPMMRIGIAAVALILVMALMPGVFALFSPRPTQDSPTTGQGQLEQIAAQYGPRIAALDGMLESQPTSYTVLMQVGHTYFDWGAEIQQAGLGASGEDRPMWLAAASFYDRALELDASIPPDLVDAAIAHFYSGNTTKAIELGEAAVAVDPEFAPAHYNLGVFYRSVGRQVEAIAAYEKAIELDPEGQVTNVEQARLALLDMAAETGTEGTTTP